MVSFAVAHNVTYLVLSANMSHRLCASVSATSVAFSIMMGLLLQEHVCKLLLLLKLELQGSSTVLFLTPLLIGVPERVKV